MGDLDSKEGSFAAERYPKRARRQVAKSIDYDDFDYGEEEDAVETGFEKKKLFTHAYDIEELLNTPEFEHNDVLRVVHTREEFDVGQMRREGFTSPTLFKLTPNELGMKVPDPQTFTVDSVHALVGGERRIEVVEVKTQSGKSMRLDEFINYYKSSEEERAERGLYNVLSLEFTLTEMEREVQCPSFVREMDWIGNVWPRELVDRQRLRERLDPNTNSSTYPKVQRYCLMSVRDCFTDFHIDFGGTSVWYHVLKGKKVFWLIEPSKHNVKLYEDWILGGNNSKSFFGRVVEKCSRVELTQGDTFFIPSGWIHCVYTPEDSLVFGGNFLHSFSIPMIIRVAKSEDVMRVRPKYRFPLFRQMLYYVVERLVRGATGRAYLRPLQATFGYLMSSAPKIPNRASGVSSQHGLDRLASISASPFDTVFKHEVSGEDCESRSEEEAEDWLTLRRSSMDEPSAETDPESGGQTQFYDNIPNGANGSYEADPTQYVFSNEDNMVENFTPAGTYNKDFVKGISDIEIDGYEMLLSFVKELLKLKAPEVGEGITRPNHLLREFEHLIRHLNQSRNHLYETISLRPRRNAVKKHYASCIYKQMQFVHDSAQLTIRLPPAQTPISDEADSSEDDESEEMGFPSAVSSTTQSRPSSATPPAEKSVAITPSVEELDETPVRNPPKPAKKPAMKRKAVEAKLPRKLNQQPSTSAMTATGMQTAVEVFDPLSEIVKLGKSSKTPKMAASQSASSFTRKILEEKRKLKERGEEKKLRTEEVAEVVDGRSPPPPAQYHHHPTFQAHHHSFNNAPSVTSKVESGASHESPPMEYRSPLGEHRNTGFLASMRIPKKRDKPQAQPEVITICEEDEAGEAVSSTSGECVYEWRAENGGCVVACSPQREEVVEEEVIDSTGWEIDSMQPHEMDGANCPSAIYSNTLCSSTNDRYGFGGGESSRDISTHEGAGSEGLVSSCPLQQQPPIPLNCIRLPEPSGVRCWTPNYSASSPLPSHRVEKESVESRMDRPQNSRGPGDSGNRTDGGRYDRWGRHGGGNSNYHRSSNGYHHPSRHHAHHNSPNNCRNGPRMATNGGHRQGFNHRQTPNSFSNSHHEPQRPRYSQYSQYIDTQQEGTQSSCSQHIQDTAYLGYFTATHPSSQQSEILPSTPARQDDEDMELSYGEERQKAGVMQLCSTPALPSAASQDELPRESPRMDKINEEEADSNLRSTTDNGACVHDDDEDLDLREQFQGGQVGAGVVQGLVQFHDQ